MGKTERRNVSQKKRSPVRTSLKLRKEKKMKGGELTEPLTKAEIDNIKNRNKDGTMESILNLVNKYEANMNEYGYIIEENDLSKPMFRLNNMIRAYFHKEFKKEDFSKNYKTYIINVINTLKTSLLKLNSKEIPPTSVSTQEEYNKHTIQNVKNFITIMKAIAEGAEIKIPTEDESAAGADDKSGELGDGTNITVTATTDLAAADKSGKSDTNITVADDDTGSDDESVAAADDKSAIVKTTASTDKSDTKEMIDKLEEGLDIISINMPNMMEDNITNKNIQSTASDVLQSTKRIIYAYMIHINDNAKDEFQKIQITRANDMKKKFPFFNDKDIEQLLKGELIITENDFLSARNSLNKLKVEVDELFPQPDPQDFQPINPAPEKLMQEARNTNNIIKTTFKENIDFLIELLGEIEKEVKKKSQDTTSETEGEINKDTNKIKEINDITIYSDEELVTLNITDQEGHIIYSYILKFTRKGEGVTNASGSASNVSKRRKDTNESGSDSDSDEDTNVSDSDEDTIASNKGPTGNDSNVSVDTSESDSDSDSDTSKLLKRLADTGKSGNSLIRSYSFGGKIKRDSINDQYNTPTTVLTARMNEPFSIDDNSFIISN